MNNALFHNQVQINADPDTFGSLRDSSGDLGKIEALRQRIGEDGYLYLPGLLDVDKVLAARRSVLERLAQEGSLDPDAPMMDGVAHPDAAFSMRSELARKNPAVEEVLYTGAMLDFFGRFLGGEVRHFDYTWLRAKVASHQHQATYPHCDVVYMGRGTPNLFSAWTPLGDVPVELGGLMVLEGSNQRRDVMGDYWDMDVDTYCTNYPEAPKLESGEKMWADDKDDGCFNRDPAQARDNLGGRWLTMDYKIGDVLIFTLFTLHASLNNNTNRVRLSTDSRYQLASEPLDERWIGENPIGHGPDAKKGFIC